MIFLTESLLTRVAPGLILFFGNMYLEKIGNAVEIVARKTCNEILEKEKKKAEAESRNQGEKDGLVGIAVSYDIGWQKRGKGHTGHGMAMGLV